VNGHVTPGTLSAVIEIPKSTAGHKVVKPTPKIDEQLFLSSDSTDGMSIHDLQSNINNKTNGIVKLKRPQASVDLSSLTQGYTLRVAGAIIFLLGPGQARYHVR